MRLTQLPSFSFWFAKLQSILFRGTKVPLPKFRDLLAAGRRQTATLMKYKLLRQQNSRSIAQFTVLVKPVFNQFNSTSHRREGPVVHSSGSL